MSFLGLFLRHGFHRVTGESVQVLGHLGNCPVWEADVYRQESGLLLAGERMSMTASLMKISLSFLLPFLTFSYMTLVGSRVGVLDFGV